MTWSSQVGPPPRLKAQGELEAWLRDLYAQFSHFTSRTASLLDDGPRPSYVINAPAATGRNRIQATAATVVPLQVRQLASDTANLTEWQLSAGTVVAKVSSNGSITGYGFNASSRAVENVADGYAAKNAVNFDEAENIAHGSSYFHAVAATAAGASLYGYGASVDVGARLCVPTGLSLWCTYAGGRFTTGGVGGTRVDIIARYCAVGADMAATGTDVVLQSKTEVAAGTTFAFGAKSALAAVLGVAISGPVEVQFGWNNTGANALAASMHQVDIKWIMVSH